MPKMRPRTNDKSRYKCCNGFYCDPGGIQTHDLQNRNLTLYSLSYQAKTLTKVEKIYALS